MGWGGPVRRGQGQEYRRSSLLTGQSRYKEDGKTYSFNSLFISMRSQQQDRIPLRMAILNLVHELMHAFGTHSRLSLISCCWCAGAKHDPDTRDRADCTPADMAANGR